MKTFKQFIIESQYNIFHHGTPDKDSMSMGKKGIHVGTKKSATQALNARIGVPAEGEWDGTREYGQTLLAGKKTLNQKNKEFGYSCTTGYNCGADVPEEDYYPTQRPTSRATYSDGSPVPFHAKPAILQFSIVGKMTNTPNTPHSDTKANSMIIRNLKQNNAKSGYYYINDAEDEGSISAVVPNFSFLNIIG